IARSSEAASRKSPVTYSSGKSLIARLLLDALTSTRTVSPRATSCRATWLPKNPAAPVTSVVMACAHARASRPTRPAIATQSSSRNLRPSDSSQGAPLSHTPRDSSMVRTADSSRDRNSPTPSFPPGFCIVFQSRNSIACTAPPNPAAHTKGFPTHVLQIYRRSQQVVFAQQITRLAKPLPHLFMKRRRRIPAHLPRRIVWRKHVSIHMDRVQLLVQGRDIMQIRV